ncbi:MAG: tetraacyldisaccharide 4'-kinase [Flavobacteriales bacterium]
MVKVVRYILFPFSVLYGLIVAFRNFLFDKKVLKSSEFDVKTILVGNLSAGGTGKTPHVEYLIRLLQDENKIATLSRGYGRKTLGFQKASGKSTAQDIGDEPLQFYNKFPDISVFVDAKRVNGVITIMSKEEVPDIVILDDAFQHRAIKAGFSILLTDYNSPFFKDFMLPTGNLREFSSGRKRADIIIVTKCPEFLSAQELQKIENRIKPLSSQQLFFSKIKYGELRGVHNSAELDFEEIDKAVLVTGIANPKPLVHFLHDKKLDFVHQQFPDHHDFTKKNIQNIITTFDNIRSENKYIVTTEKDAMRLMSHKELEQYPIFYLGIEVEIIDKINEFDKLIKNYVREN